MRVVRCQLRDEAQHRLVSIQANSMELYSRPLTSRTVIHQRIVTNFQGSMRENFSQFFKLYSSGYKLDKWLSQQATISTTNTIYCFIYAITHKAEEQTSHITPYLISSMKSNAKSQTVHLTSSTRMSDYVITHFTWWINHTVHAEQTSPFLWENSANFNQLHIMNELCCLEK